MFSESQPSSQNLVEFKIKVISNGKVYVEHGTNKGIFMLQMYIKGIVILIMETTINYYKNATKCLCKLCLYNKMIHTFH